MTDESAIDYMSSRAYHIGYQRGWLDCLHKFSDLLLKNELLGIPDVIVKYDKDGSVSSIEHRYEAEK
jgi:hypothetical protein